MPFGLFEAKGRYDEIDLENVACKNCRCKFFQKGGWNDERDKWICRIASSQQGNHLRLSNAGVEEVRQLIQRNGGAPTGCPKGFDNY